MQGFAMTITAQQLRTTHNTHGSRAVSTCTVCKLPRQHRAAAVASKHAHQFQTPLRLQPRKFAPSKLGLLASPQQAWSQQAANPRTRMDVEHALRAAAGDADVEGVVLLMEHTLVLGRTKGHRKCDGWRENDEKCGC